MEILFAVVSLGLITGVVIGWTLIVGSVVEVWRDKSLSDRH